MSNNDFLMDIVAKLNKQLSKRQIQGDLKALDNSMYVKVIAKLSKTLTQKALKQQLKELNKLEVQVGTNVKFDKNERDKIQNNIKQLQKSLSDIEVGLKVSNADKANRDIDSEIQGIQKRVRNKPVSIDLNLELKKQKLISDIEYLGKRYSKIFGNILTSKKYETIMNNAYSVSDKNQLANVRAELQAFTSELKAHGLAVQSASDKYKGLVSRIKDLFSTAAVFKAVVSQAKEAVSATIELDKVYTELVKVNSELSRNDYADYLSRCNQKAKELATTQKGLIEGAAEFSKSGYNLETSNKLTEKSTILSNVGEMSASDSAKAIISGVQAYDEIDGYKDAVDKAGALIDKYNEIENTASIKASEIARGVQSVGSVFADDNTSVDEYISLLSAGNRQYQDADSLALGLRTAALRIRGCTAELEEMGEETDTVVASASKLQEQIKGLTDINGNGGVDIFEADGETFRSIYDIFLDISKVYKEMSDVDASALLELIAGKNRASAISATLNNMTEAETILQTSLHAAGSAQKEYDAYLESTEAHIQQFKATLVETYTSFLDGDMVSHVVDIGTAVLDLCNKTDLLKHGIIAVLTLNVGKGVATVGAAIVSTVKQMNILGNTLQQVENLPVDSTRVDALEQVGNATKSLTEKNLKLLLSQKRLQENDRITILQQHDLTEEEAKLKLEKMGLTTATNANTAANTANTTSVGTLKGALTGLTASAKAAWAAMSTLQKVSIIFAAVSTAWSVTSMLISNNNEKMEEARRKAVEATDAYKQQQSSLDSEIAKYRELKEQLDKGNLSVDEAREIKEQLYEIQKNLVDSYGSEASNIDLVNGKYKEQLGLLGELSKEKASEYLKKNYSAFENAKKELGEKRRYDLGTLFSYNPREGMSDVQKQIYDYIESYSKSFDIKSMYDTSTIGTSDFAPELFLNASADDARTIINTFLDDLQAYIDSNGLEFSIEGIKLDSANVLTEIDKDEVVKESRAIYDEYMKAEIVHDDTLRPLYKQSIQVVEDYNRALSSGEGVAEAKANLDSVQQSVQDVTGKLEGSQEIFDGIYEGVNKSAESAYHLGQVLGEAFENNESVKGYAEQLRGLTDSDLKAINFEDTIQSPGEETFGALIRMLGLSEEEVQGLIDKLVELGYVQNNVKESSSNNEDSAASFNPATFSESVEALSSLQDTYNDFYNDVQDGRDIRFDFADIEKLRGAFGETCDSFDEFEQAATSSSTTAEQMQSAFDTLAAEYIYNSNILDGLNSSNRNMIVSQLELQGILGANAFITEEFAEAIADAKNANFDFANATLAQINGFIQEGQYADDTKQRIYAYAIQKILANENCLNTVGDIMALETLCKNLGIATDSLTWFARAKNLQEKVDNGATSDIIISQLNTAKNKCKELASEISITSSGYSNMGQSASNASKSTGAAAKETEKEVDIMAELNSEMDKYQSKLDAVKDARETYNKYGKITVDQAQDIVDADFKLLAAYGDEEAALESLGQAKLNEMQIQLARNAIDTINNITSEAEATEYLAGANEHLVGASLSATEAMLQQAVAAAKVRGAMQGQAADTILKGYQNGAMMIGQVDFGFKIPDEKKEKDSKKEAEKEKDFSKQMDWIERLLNRLSKATEKLKDSAEKFVSWWRKNNALDKAMRANRKEISGNEDAYYYYLKKANGIGLGKKYKKLVQDGSIRIQDVKDEGLADKIEKYQEWYDKAQDCKDTIEDLYDAEREMINQKYDNMLEFYDSLDEKIQSVINKVESLMGLKEARGKQIDINDLLEEFDAYEDVIGQMQETGKTSGQNKDDHTEIIEVSVSNRDLNGEITEAVKQSAIYKGLLSDIEKLEAKREKNEKLSKTDTAKLESFYAKRKELEEKATADTIVQYNKTYDAFMKLQAKLNKGQSLSKSQRIKYDQYKAELDGFEKQRQDQILDLQKELDNVPEKITNPGQSYEKRKEEIRSSYESQISDAQNDVRNTKQYKALKAEIENLEAAQAKKGLSKSKQEKLDAKRAELAALERGATSVNISEYIKAYERFTKLSNKKTLNKKERSEYDTLSAQLKQWDQSKQDSINQLREQMNDTLENLASEQGNAANDAASSLADNQAKAYETAKKIAEIGASALQSELDVLDSYMSKMEKRLSLYQKFGVESLKKLGYIESDLDTTQSELIMDEFKNYLKNSNEKRDKLIGQRDIYQKLIDSVNTHDYDEIKKMYEGGVFEQYGDTFDKVIALLKDNTFDGYSLEWVKEWEQSVSDIDQSIDDINIKIQDLQDTMREEVTFRAINEAVTQLGYLKDELSSMSGLFSEEILYGEDGSLSEYGVGKAAVLIEQLENSQKLAMEYREKYTRALSDDTFASEKDKQEYLNNLKNQYMQELNETKSFTEQIVSLYEKQKASEVNALKDIIKKRKEALQAKKEYYDWDKNLKEKNKDIDALKAQIAAVETVNTAESKAKLESLKAELAEKEEELNELKEDHLYDMQMDALDQFSEWLSEDTEAKLKSLEYQKEIVDKLSEITEGHDINDTISALEQFYLGLSGKDSIFNGHDIAANNTAADTNVAPQPKTNGDMVTVPKWDGTIRLMNLENDPFGGMDIEELKNSPLLQWNVPMPKVVNNAKMEGVDYECAPNRVTNVEVYYDKMLNVEGNVDSYVVNDLKRHMEEQYKYTKSRLTSDLKKVGVH